jgi:tetratricopeptide (TPR) repeat protein
MATEDEVRSMIAGIWEAPEGPGQIALAEEALLHAEASGDADLAFDARMTATSAFHRGGEPAKAFVTFARCLTEYDADPGRRTAQDEHLLLWYFKYIVSSMAKFPEVPLERTQAVLDDMERRFRSGGHSLHAVYAYRHVIASHVGDTALADHWYQMWDAAPRDENSDCAGCDPTSKVHHLVWRERYDEAIAVAEPALAGRLTCSEQPQSILTALMIPYLRTGRPEQARDAHRRAYRAFQTNPADLGSVADHVEFCGLTGNEMRGLELIERHLTWLERPPTPKAELEFASAAAQVLRRLAEAGKGDLAVRVTRPGADRTPGGSGKPSPAATVADLAAELSERAMQLARRFDERNGNGYQSERVTRRLHAEPIVEYLPLSITAAYRSRVASTPEPEPEPEPVDLTDAPESLSLDEQLAIAEEWLREQDPRSDALTDRLLAGWPQLLQGGVLTAAQQGRLAHLRVSRLPDHDLIGIQAELAVAAAAFAEDGDLAREAGCRVQMAIARFQDSGDPAELAVAQEAAGEVFDATDDPVLRRVTWLRIAYLRTISGDPEAAMAALDTADAEPGPQPLRHRVQSLMMRAGLLHSLDRVDDTLALVREVIEVLRSRGRSDELASALVTYANLTGGIGDHAGALAAFEEAGTVAVDPELRRSARANAGFMLVNSDRAGEVIDDIVEHVCLMAAEGEDRAAAYTRHRLAVALATTRRFREAAEVAEEALAWFAAQPDLPTDSGDRAGGERAMADDCRDLLARIYDEMGEPHAALTQLEALAAGRTGFDDAGERAQLLERMAEVLYRVDRDRDAAARYAEAAAGYRAVGERLPAARALRRRILALHYGRDPDGAAEALREATTYAQGADPAEEPGVVWEHAMACYDGAFVLADRRSYPEALAAGGAAPGLFRSIEAFEEAAFAELRYGEILVAAGDPGQGEVTLRRVIEGLPRDHQARTEAAWWLARALEELGETKKAKKLRKEYDLPESD